MFSRTSILASIIVLLAAVQPTATRGAEPLPLCQGLWPQKNALPLALVREEPSKSAARKASAPSFGSFSESLDDVFLPGKSVGLSSNTKLLSRNLTGSLPNATALRDWKSTTGTLGKLPKTRQDEVLRAAGLFDIEGNISTTNNLAETQFRVAQAKRISEALIVQDALDPSIRSSFLKDIPSGTPTEKLLAMAELPEMKFWSKKLVQARQIGELLGKSNPTVQVVASGDPTAPGALGLVPRGVPVAFGQTATGTTCVRPATDADYKFDFKSMSIGRKWDPTAFPDVGLLIWKSIGTTPAELDICSFVRIADSFVVTAAHCVIKTRNAGSWSAKDYSSPDIHALALLPKLDAKEKRPDACFNSPDNCGFHVAKLSGTAVLPEDLKLREDQPKIPVPDLAILKVSFPSNVHAPTISVAISGSAIQKLTLAGYGLTNDPSGGYSGDLRVGWQRKPPRLEDTTIVWAVDPLGGFAGACNGDSGGAVFEGDIAVPGDQSRLAGLVSYGSGGGAATGLNKCMKMTTGTATRLDKNLPWICSSTGNLVRGCGGK